jgi:phosphopantothenoylcysteine synthetase/decarboxylase
MPVSAITVIVCGAPLAARVPDVLLHVLSRGWRPTVVATPAAAEWLDDDAVEALTGGPPRTAFRASTQRKAGAAAAVLVCPATFNTLNKAAAGAADTYALALLCEALGARLPTVIVPMVNSKLWCHPVWDGTLSVLRSAGALVMDVRTGGLGARPVASGTADDIVAGFDPRWISAILPATS